MSLGESFVNVCMREKALLVCVWVCVCVRERERERERDEQGPSGTRPNN